MYRQPNKVLLQMLNVKAEGHHNTPIVTSVKLMHHTQNTNIAITIELIKVTTILYAIKIS